VTAEGGLAQKNEMGPSTKEKFASFSSTVSRQKGRIAILTRGNGRGNEMVTKKRREQGQMSKRKGDMSHTFKGFLMTGLTGKSRNEDTGPRGRGRTRGACKVL